MHPLDDTIAAIASVPGGAARGIVRVSGPAVERCLEACFRAKNEIAASPLPTNLRSVPGKGPGVRACVCEGELHLPGVFSPLPCEVYLWPAGRSYTGQTVAEFHTFGSPPLLESLLKMLCAAGARLAEPGEFTLRAFLSGRIDLTQAEAVLGVIDAADPRQLQTALGQLAGGLAGPLHELRGELLELLAHLEAGLDFAEEDISFITAEQIERQLASAAERAAALIEKMASRNLAETAAKAVLIGRPNTGKSSLFNAICACPKAICGAGVPPAQAAGTAAPQNRGALVSATPGTTRDYLSAELDLGGVKCQLIDTAGIEPDFLPSAIGRGAVESAAQSATQEQHRRAAIRILCLDATRKPNDWEREQIEKSDPCSCIVALTKIDVGQVSNLSLAEKQEGRQVGNLSYKFVATSSATGEGMELLRGELRQKILSLENAGGEVVAGTAARCGESLKTAAECIERAGTSLRQKAGEEFVAGEIRLALEELGCVAGAVYTDDVLDRIFSRFCVGK